jgi:3-hydroxy-9,10-secoandrosta-1,3,5(10)-triene-9,17-dione monooxygenase reductase component
LVLVCLDKTGGSYGSFRIGAVYAVHVLEEHQTELSTRFALHGGDKFAGLQCREGLGRVPILPGYLALFECTIVQAHDAGDHTIFVGRVERLDVSDSDRRPLGFFRGKYIRVHRHPAAYVPEEVVELWGLGWA